MVDEGEIGVFFVGKYVEILVSDNGLGILVDVIESIFELFFIIKKNGIGFGLFMV